jgi:PAS domain S-box-containing protein
MVDNEKTKDELLMELQELKKENEALKAHIDSDNIQLILDKLQKDKADEQFKLIFDEAAVGMSLTDIYGSFLNVNKTLCNILGYSKEELLKKNFFEITHPDDIAKTNKIISKYLSKDELSSHFEKRYIRKDGEIIWVEIISTLLFDEKNEPLYYIVQTIDITERKQAEEKSILYQDIVKNIRTGLYIYKLEDLNDDRSLKMIYANPITEEYTGVLVEDVIGKTLDENFPLLREKQIPQKYAEVVRTKKNIVIEDIYYGDSRVLEAAFTMKAFALPDNQVGISFENITKRKLAEEELRRSEEIYRSLLTNLDAGIVVHSPNTSIIKNNQIAAELLGLSLDQMKGKTAIDPDWKFIHENNIPFLLDEYPVNQIINNKKIINNLSVGIVRPATNDIVWVNVNGFPVFDNQGDISEVLISFIDITKRKQAEQALKESEEKYRTIIDNLGEGVSILDTFEVFTYANSQAEKIFGTNGDLVGKSMLEFLSDDNRNKVINESEKRRKGITSTYEHEIILLDGTKKAIYVTATPKYDEAGEFAGNYAIFMDISYLKKNEADLLESLSMLDASLESTVDGILIVSNNGSISRWNKKFAEMWHLPESIISNLDDSFVMNHVISQLSDPMQFIEKVNYLYRHPNESSFDQIKFMDGRIFERYSQSQKIGNDVIGRVWSFRDITERIQSEEKIQKQNIELIELNNSKDRFFSIIAHDLLGPMNGFLGLTKMMAEETSDFTLKELQKISYNMMRSSNNLYDLLKNLLDWSRIQRGMMEFKPVQLDLKRATHGTLQILTESFNQKQIEFIDNIPENVNVLADEQMLNTILRNFVSNSIKFTNIGGKIEVGVTSNGINLAPIIYIKDTGIGMNSDMIEKLFRLDRDVSRPGTGNELSTGLGLLLCKEFVEMHGGNIWVESEEGKGTTFYFMIENKKNLNNFNKG